MQSHNTCVTESQKYAEGATKPGGFAAKGFFEASGGAAAATAAPSGDPAEDEFLSKRPPWKCRCGALSGSVAKRCCACNTAMADMILKLPNRYRGSAAMDAHPSVQTAEHGLRVL